MFANVLVRVYFIFVLCCGTSMRVFRVNGWVRLVSCFCMFCCILVGLVGCVCDVRIASRSLL